MECLSSDFLQPSYLCPDPPLSTTAGIAFFSTSNQYPALWILPPKYLIPFSSTVQLLPQIQVTTNSRL